MRTVADISREELDQSLGLEIAKARAEARPVSRLTLTRLLQSNYSLHPQVAERYVDKYCDEKAPGVPTYLSTEFGVPYLKIVAGVQYVLAVAVYFFTIQFQNTFLTLWSGTILGTVFVAVGTFCLLRSMRPVQEKAPSVRLSPDMPRMNYSNEPADPAETVSTGS